MRPPSCLKSQEEPFEQASGLRCGCHRRCAPAVHVHVAPRSASSRCASGSGVSSQPGVPTYIGRPQGVESCGPHRQTLRQAQRATAPVRREKRAFGAPKNDKGFDEKLLRQNESARIGTGRYARVPAGTHVHQPVPAGTSRHAPARFPRRQHGRALRAQQRGPRSIAPRAANVSRREDADRVNTCLPCRPPRRPETSSSPGSR